MKDPVTLPHNYPREVDCTACFAPRGKPCTTATDASRRAVTWHHYAREQHATRMLEQEASEATESPGSG